MWLFRSPDIGRMKEENNINGLVKALRYKRDRSISSDAAAALGDIGDAQAVEPLIAALKYGPCSRLVIAEALGKIGSSQAVEPLIATLKDKQGSIRRAAAEALERLGWKPDGGEVEAWYWTARGDWERASSLGKLAVEPLINALEQGKLDERQAIAEALGKIGSPQAVEPLMNILWNGQESQKLQNAAALAIAKIGDPSTFELLIQESSVMNEQVRKNIAETLGKSARAIEPLVAALKVEDGFVRKAAVETLGDIGDVRAVEPLIATLNDKYGSVRKAAAEALGKIGDLKAVEPLVFVLKDVDRQVRKTAAEVLECFGWKPDGGEAEAWYWITHSDLEKAAALGPEAVNPLITVIMHDELTLRDDATQALSKILRDNNIQGAVKPLITFLKGKDSDDEQISVAAEVLGLLGLPETVKPLQSALKKHTATVRAGLKESNTDFARLILDQFENARKAAGPNLKKMGDGELQLELEKFLNILDSGNKSKAKRLEPLVRDIGEELYARGGVERMATVLKGLTYTATYRRIEGIWDGIGGWYG